VSPFIAKAPALKGPQACVNPTSASASAKPVHITRALIVACCASPAVKPKSTG